MKLELKHIVPYTPYGLKVQWGVHTFEVVGASCLKRLSVIVKYYNQTAHYTDVKPILRPLTDLPEFMEDNGIKTWFRLGVSGAWAFDLAENDCPTYAWEILQCYKEMQLLFKNHYDIFGLIENGLAIDINTLEK